MKRTVALLCLLSVPAVVVIAEEPVQQTGAEKTPQQGITSDWGAVVDGLRCRAKDVCITNLSREPGKVFVAATIEITNVVAIQRIILLSWNREAIPRAFKDLLHVDLVPTNAGTSLGYVNEGGIDFKASGLSVIPGTEDIEMSLHPKESKAVRVVLGISKDVFSADVEKASTMFRLYQIIPPRSLFLRDKKSNLFYWQGPMETGPVNLAKEP